VLQKDPIISQKIQQVKTDKRKEQVSSEVSYSKAKLDPHIHFDMGGSHSSSFKFV
jgi:hypothetical protein